MANNTSFTSGRDLNSVSENVELLTGQRGNQLDRAVTYRDLESLGVATLSKVGSSYKATANSVLTSSSGVVYFPSKPNNVVASGAFNTILIDWDEPDYRGHAYAEVWRADSDNLSIAVRIGTTNARMYSDPIGGDAKVYYWVRFVNTKDVAGPYNSSSGTYAETAVDVQQLLDSLQGMIEESQLSQALRSDIALIPSINTSIQQISVDLTDLNNRQETTEITQNQLRETLETARSDLQKNTSGIADVAVDVTALKTAQASLNSTTQSLNSSVNSITIDLSSLTTRQSQAEEILKAANDLIGKTTIDVSLLHDSLSQQVQKYTASVDNLRDAILTVDPATGEITIDAVNLVRSELQENITEVSQRVSSVEGVLTQKASTVEVGLQAQRLSTVESQMNSINAELTNQVTRAEFTETEEDVTQLTTRLSAAEGVITTKASQQTVDAFGTRLSSAETALSVANTTNQSQAQQISALQSALTTDIADVKSQVSTVSNALSTQTQAIGSRVDQVVADYKAGDDENTAAIKSVEDALSSATSATAQQLSSISTSVSNLQSSVTQLAQSVTDGDETTASLYTQVNAISGNVSAMQGTISQLSAALATEKETSVSVYQQLKAQADAVAIAASHASLDGDVLNRTYRNNAATVQSQIKAVVTSAESLAQVVSILSVNFESENAELLAKITSEQTARATADESIADSINALSASYKSADATLTATIQSESQARATEDAALSSRIDVLSASTAGNTAMIQAEQTARASSDSALTSKIDALSASTSADKTSLSAQISVLSQAVTSKNESLSERVSDLDAKYDSATNSLSAQITQNETARIAADSAQSSRADSIESGYKSADTSLNAKIANESTARSDADSALSTRIDQVTASVGSNLAEIKAEETARASGDAAISSKVDALTARTTNSESAIQVEQSARSSADNAMAQQITDLSSTVKNGDDSLNSKITSLTQSTTTADQALSQRADSIESAYKSADATQSAAISSLSSAVADFESSTATQFNELNSSVDGLNSDITVLQQSVATQSETSANIYSSLQSKTDIAAIAAASAALSDDESSRSSRSSEASIRTNLKVLTNDHESLAKTVEVLQADFETETAAISAQIANEKTARTTAVDSLAQVVSTIDASYKSADVTTNARIATEETARASADSALSTRVDQVLATTNNNTAEIQNEALTRASANESLSTQISTVQATANSKNKIHLQSPAPTTGLTVGDIWYDSDDSNKSYRWGGTAWVAVSDVRISQNVAAIQSEATARSNADTALGSRIDTVQATANNLTASAQTQSQAISTLENGAQAMWTAKTQVGQITAGIGVMTNSNGESQVMISASQLFMFDPNGTAPTRSIFAVSNDQVVIQKAVIEAATIETVTAMSITADYVRAGVSLTSPNLVGGTLSIGSGDNALFLADGAIGIGKGGPYGGWGSGWHTIIYNDGGIHTDRLHASSGDFTGYVRATSGYMTNVTIGEDCSVLGTVYANKIVGDVVAIKTINSTLAWIERYNFHTLRAITIQAKPYARSLLVIGYRVTGTVTSQRMLLNGVESDGRTELNPNTTYTLEFQANRSTVADDGMWYEVDAIIVGRSSGDTFA